MEPFGSLDTEAMGYPFVHYIFAGTKVLRKEGKKVFVSGSSKW